MPISERLLTLIRDDKFTGECFSLNGVFGSDGSACTDEDVSSLVKALMTNTHINSVNVAQTGVGDASAKLLATVSTLKHINLSYTRVTSEGVKALLQQSHAKELILNGLGLGDDCLDGIQENKTLKILGLSANQITDEGVKLISKNNTLEFISLNMNFTINDECAYYFASMKSLKNLNLANNALTIVGAKVLKESSIQKLFLEGNDFDEEEFLKLTKSPSPSFPAFEASKKPKRKEEDERETNQKEEVEDYSKRVKISRET